MERIKQLYAECEKAMRIYIYPFYPKEHHSLRSFIDYVKNDENYNWGETYKSWVYFTDFLLKSELLTTNENEADLYLVLQWENYNGGRNYHDDLVSPLKKAIDGPIYKATDPLRNHIFIYISDDTPLFEWRIPPCIRKELERRFVRLTFSGRIPNFGRYHTSRTNIGIFNFDYRNEIVLPCGIPQNEFTKAHSSKSCVEKRNKNFYYKGTLNPPEAQIERAEFLNLIKKHSDINSDTNNVYGIHAAGWGIWTARFYHYMQLGIIPIFQSDGVIMPFERFLNYEAFSVKLLSNVDNDDVVRHLLDVDLVDSNIQKMLDNIKSVKDFLNWKSTDRFKNPFTLTVIELYDFVKMNNKESITISEKSYIAKKQFCHVDNELPDLYREEDPAHSNSKDTE